MNRLRGSATVVVIDVFYHVAGWQYGTQTDKQMIG